MCYDVGMWKIYGLDIRKLMGQELMDTYMDKLSAERRAHIRKIKNIKEQYRSLGAGLLLEYGFEQAHVSLEDREICIDTHGKPRLKRDIGVCFNVSHSGDYAVAIFADSEAGIDIEHRRALRKGMAERSCTAGELEWLSKQEDKEMAFIRLWTAKESYVKWSGEGLTCSLTELEVQTEQSGNCRGIWKHAGGRIPVVLYEYQAPKDYGICVCISRKKAAGEGGTGNVRWLTVEELMRG